MRLINRSLYVTFYINIFILFSLIYFHFFQVVVKANNTKDELRIVSQHAPRSLGIPYTSNGRPSMYYWRAIYDTLTEIDVNDQLSPSLAVSWNLKSPLVWEFKIRNDVFFSNGNKFNTDSIIATFSWLIDTLEGQSTLWGREVRTIEKVYSGGNNLVLFKTRSPDPILPKRLSGVFILPKYAFNDLNKFSLSPIGTGSFFIKSWRNRRGQTAMLSSDKSWRPASFNKLTFIPAANDVSRVQALFSNQADLDPNVAIELLPDIIDYGLEVTKIRMGAVQSFMFRTVGNESSPVNNVKVRQAINYAVRKDLLSELISNQGEPTGQSAPSFVYGYNPDVFPYPYDPDKARKLLQEAGYSKNNPINLTLTVSTSELTMSLFAQRIVQDLAEVGISIKLIPTSGIQWLQMYNNSTFKSDLFNLSWNSSPFLDSSRPLEYTSCLRYKPFFCDKAIMPLIEGAQTELNNAKRLNLLQSAQEMINIRAPAIFLFEYIIYSASNNRVKDVPFRLTVPAYDLIRLN